MKNIRQDSDDSLRPEYRRSDFGEMIQGKYATTQVQILEMVRLLLACIGEDEGLKFIHHSVDNCRAGHKPGDWTYEIDRSNQITLRYWFGESGNLQEPMANSSCITTPQERSDLEKLIRQHVWILKAKVSAL